MAKTPRLLDQWGNPIETALLAEELAAPTLGGVRNIWSESVLSGLTPISMANTLKQAGRGFPDQFFVLAEEMEERDLHYGSVLGTRKRAITGIDPIIVPASNSAQDVKIADAVRDMIKMPGFIDDYLTDLLDALGKGYSVVETIWDRQATEWQPQRFEWRDPRHFQIDQIDGRTIRLKDPSHRDGIDLSPFKFSVHRPKLKSGLPIRGGLARLAAFAFLFKSYTLKDWMAFLEVYGMPLRVGRFGRGASHDDRRVLLQAVRDISTDAAAIIPKEMEIEFIEVSGGTGNGLFSAKAEYLDKQISKGVLGQTMSTDDGSSLAQAKVHENVRYDIAKADARQTAVTVNRDLIRPFVDLNHGPQKHYPTLVIQITENEDIKALSEVVSKLVDHGLEVSMSMVRQRIGFDAPEEGEKLLYPVKQTAAENDQETETKPATASALRTACAHCGGFHAVASDQRDELDILAEDALQNWETVMKPIQKPLQKLFESSSNYEELLSGLEDMEAKLETGPMADAIAKLLMKARGLGDIGEGRNN